MTSIVPLRVGIDGFNLALPRGTGVASYARTLSQCLTSMGHTVDVIYGMNITHNTPPALREVIFFDSLDQESNPRAPKFPSPRWWAERRDDFSGHEAVEVPITGRVESRGFVNRMPSFDHILNVPMIFKTAARYFRRTGRFLTITVPDTPEIMHWTYPLPIRLKGARNIYTIHDLVPLRLPQTTLDNKTFHFRLIRAIARKADGICTVSEASRQEILSFFPEAAPRIYNTYQSFLPSKEALERSDAEVAHEIDGLFGLKPDGFYLFFGSLEPKKNIGRIIEGFLASNTDRPLVLVGAMAWKSENELRFLELGISRGRIKQLEYLPAPVLMALIRSARAVLFPSLSEGFGLPVLEAMAFGTPVMTSREGALPEVAGDAALYVDAYNTASITNGIEILDKDDELCLKLTELSPQQVEKFSPSAYERRINDAYVSLMAK